MRKILLTLTLAGTLSVQNIQAQDAFGKGSTVLNLGLGLGGVVGYWGAGYSATPYLNTSLDIGVYEFPDVKGLSIGLGGYLGYKSTSYTYGGTWVDKKGNIHYDEPVKSTWTYFAIGFRPTIHYSFSSANAEVYAGLPLGYVIVSHKYSNPEYAYYANTTYPSYVGYGLIFGGRYFFSKSFGAYLELGYGISYLNLGVSFKFK
ncbi:MAG: hypothetical protein KatS3mg027_1168 [Bacteroidia bacterium]|nr:MAG: hypothetical protein KatS3mg027_1168 [Bacteroidia bacterium]